MEEEREEKRKQLEEEKEERRRILEEDRRKEEEEKEERRRREDEEKAKFTFPRLMLIIAQVLKEKWFKITCFAHSQTTNKLMNEAANDSDRVSGQDRKKPPALGTNQIAGFGGFRPLASLEKNKKTYFNRRIASETRAERKLFFFTNYLGFVNEKITDLSCSVSLDEAVIINLLNNKSRNIAQKEITIENRNYSKYFS